MAHLMIVIVVIAEVSTPASDAETHTIIGLINRVQYPMYTAKIIPVKNIAMDK
jgi:hypothetical protein